MEAFQVGQAVRRAIQYTVAQRITREVQVRIPSLSERSALTGGAALLAVAMRRSERASASVAADLALIVATATLMQGVAAEGPDSLPLKLAHLCAILEAGSALSAVALGELGGSFLGQVQYTFANSVSALLLSGRNSAVSFAAAGGLAGLSTWVSGADSALSTAFSQAAFNVVKVLLLQSIPAALQLPTIAALLAFVKPISGSGGELGRSVYNFALYQAGDGIQTAIEQHLKPFTAACAAIALAMVTPIRSLCAAAQVAAVGSTTDWVLSLVQEAADRDPVPSLVSILVFCSVIVRLSSAHAERSCASAKRK